MKRVCLAATKCGFHECRHGYFNERRGVARLVLSLGHPLGRADESVVGGSKLSLAYVLSLMRQMGLFNEHHDALLSHHHGLHWCFSAVAVDCVWFNRCLRRP